MPLVREPNPVPQRLGPYVLGERLGGGGMGDVYAATHVLMPSRRVAIKLLKPQLADRPERIQRFLREIAALGAVPPHPNLVRADFADIADDVPYLVMEFVEGIDLNQAVARQGTLNVGDACGCAAQAAEGLKAIHQAGLVHRDVKPSNLMLTADGIVKVLDLGLARLSLESHEEKPAEELTSAHAVLGTLDFTAPEQCEDPRSVDIRADIYSLGCTLFKLLTGRAPYAEMKSPAQKMMAHATVPFPRLPDSMPAELQAILDRMTAKRAEARFADPKEVSIALQAFSKNKDRILLPVASMPESVETPSHTPVPGPETVSYAEMRKSSTTMPAAERPRQWKRVWIAAAAACVASAILLSLWAASRGADSFDTERLAPGKWHPLFGHEPAKLLWTSIDGGGHTKYERDMHRFFIAAQGMGYFKLGQVRTSDYKFQATFSTTALERVGLFFAYRTNADDSTLAPDEVARFDYVAFRKAGEPQTPVLERGWAKIQRAADGRLLQHSYPSKDADIPARLGERVLEAALSRRHLARISLDNVLIEDLNEVRDRVAPDRFRGAFGVFAVNNACDFRDAKCFLMPADNE